MSLPEAVGQHLVFVFSGSQTLPAFFGSWALSTLKASNSGSSLLRDAISLVPTLPPSSSRIQGLPRRPWTRRIIQAHLKISRSPPMASQHNVFSWWGEGLGRLWGAVSPLTHGYPYADGVQGMGGWATLLPNCCGSQCGPAPSQGCFVFQEISCGQRASGYSPVISQQCDR